MPILEVRHFEKRLQTDTADRSGAFDLREKVQTDSHFFGKIFLRVSALFAIISYLQTERDIPLRIISFHSTTSNDTMLPIFHINYNYLKLNDHLLLRGTIILYKKRIVE